VTGRGQVMRAMQQLHATVADWIKNPFNIQTIEMHNCLSCTATKSDATVGRTLMFATRFRDGRNPNWGKDETNVCIHCSSPARLDARQRHSAGTHPSQRPRACRYWHHALRYRTDRGKPRSRLAFWSVATTQPPRILRALLFPTAGESRFFLHANSAFARQRLNSPMISAFANVLKCKLNPTTAADVSALMSSLSVLTAKTVNK
jgi:hypothetical protein